MWLSPPLTLAQTYAQHKIKCWKHGLFHSLHNTTMRSFKKGKGFAAYRGMWQQKERDMFKPWPLSQTQSTLWSLKMGGFLGCGRQSAEKWERRKNVWSSPLKKKWLVEGEVTIFLLLLFNLFLGKLRSHSARWLYFVLIKDSNSQL